MRRVVQKKPRGWEVKAQDPPILATQDWIVSGILGLLFISAAILQLISFPDFRDILEKAGVSGASAWAMGIILAELFGAVGFFRIRLSYLARVVSGSLALLASGFWFIVVAQTVAGTNSNASSIGFFGRFLNQEAGWWTIVEVTILLFWTMYAVALTRYTAVQPKRK